MTLRTIAAELAARGHLNERASGFPKGHKVLDLPIPDGRV
jgi:hypothetical protein